MPWVEAYGAHCRGFAFAGERYLTGVELARYIASAVVADDCDLRIATLNGHFIAIVEHEDKVYLVADKLRTYPLLYAVDDDDFIVADSADEMMRHLKHPALNADALPYYLASGYLYGEDTLVEGCYTLPPASVAVAENGQVKLHTYYNRLHAKHHATPDDIVYYRAITDRMVARLRTVAHGRQVVIPLSGGYDSRHVACLCRRAGLTDVVCYTYGTSGSDETAVAGRVAHLLGYPIHVMEYTPAMWRTVFDSGDAQRYMLSSANLNSIAHMYDLAVLYRMHSQGLIRPDAIFMPGHSGDFLAGTHFTDFVDSRNTVHWIYENYFNINVMRCADERKIKRQIAAQIGQFEPIDTLEASYEAIFQWNLNSRQPYYINNWNRVFEYFGHTWFMPLWDDEYLAFWSSISCVDRKRSDIYYDYLFSEIFAPLGVDIRKTEKPRKSLPMRFLARYVPFAPKYRAKLLLEKLGLYHFSPDNSLLNVVADLIRPLGQYQGVPLLPCRENSMSAKTMYYLHHVNKSLKPK